MNENHILLVDDEPHFLESVQRVLSLAGYTRITAVNRPRAALALFERSQFDAAVIDMSMPEMTGLELLAEIKQISPETECLMLTGMEEVELAVKAMRLGAYDYLVKPVSRDKLLISMERALERKRLLHLLDLQRQQMAAEFLNAGPFAGIVTVSPLMLRMLREAELHARSTVPVLITGESGTGKELLARAIHEASERAGHPFVAVNMASLSSTLFESEFFGHIRGAFTGADRDREGYLEVASGGTLFLDEIGDLSLELQGKLLRVLQEKEFVKVGTSRVKRIEVRFVAATNCDLDRMVTGGKFRKDLYYRLKVAWLHIPPLRERLEDIPVLVDYILRQLAMPDRTPRISPQALERLSAYQYPGNVRELYSILQAANNLAQGQSIRPEHLPREVRALKPQRPAVLSPGGEELLPLAVVEREHIMQVYTATGGNKAQAARILGIGLSTLQRKLRDYKVD